MHEQNEKFSKEVENKKEPNRNPGAEEYSDRIEKFNRALQQCTQSYRRKNQQF